jgi:hypothetical protein
MAAPDVRRTYPSSYTIVAQIPVRKGTDLDLCLGVLFSRFGCGCRCRGGHGASLLGSLSFGPFGGAISFNLLELTAHIRLSLS